MESQGSSDRLDSETFEVVEPDRQSQAAVEEPENVASVTLPLSELKELREELVWMKQAILDAKNDALVTRAGVHEMKRQRETIRGALEITKRLRRLFWLILLLSIPLALVVMAQQQPHVSNKKDGSITVVQQLEKLMAEKAQLKSKLERQQKVVAECRNASAVLVHEKTELEEQNEDLKRDVDLWTERKSEFEDTANNLRQEISTLKETIQESKKEVKEMKHSLLEAEKEKNFLKQEAKMRKGEKVRLESENRDLEKKVIDLKLANSDLKLENSKWEEGMESMQSELALLKYQKTLHTNRLESYKKAYEELKQKARKRRCSFY